MFFHYRIFFLHYSSSKCALMGIKKVELFVWLITFNVGLRLP